ncbi:amino acid permease [Vagococcus fessus]|nr:amino acid permease [Vagococcus fessus]
MSKDNVAVENDTGLKRSMKVHQIVMLGVGGTIGTGLFVGSGYTISQAGPGGTLVAYGFGAFIMYLMMMCLGELLVAKPIAGGVQAYATEFIGDSMGFTVGWVKWLSYSITVPTQLVASSIIMKNIFPTVPGLFWIIVFMGILFFMNARPAEKYGNMNFWFSSIKFVLIIVFIIVGTGMILGIGQPKPIGFSNFTQHGGLFPNGMKAVLMTMMVSAFAYGGADMFATTASESENPEKDMPKAINSVIFGLLAAYFASFVVLLAILPWNQTNLNGSPFADVFKQAGFKSAELVVNIVVLTSALSSANAFIYSSVRSLWSMGLYNQAPKFVTKVNKNQVPLNALIVTMIFALFAVFSSILSPDVVYLFLTSLIGISNMFIYVLYGVCVLLFRKTLKEQDISVKTLKYKVPSYPLIPLLLIGICILVFIGMFFDPTQKSALITGIPVYVLIYLGSSVYYKNKKVKTGGNE